MRKLAVVIFLLLCTASSIYGQKIRFGQQPTPSTNPDDYTIKVHISGIHFRSWCAEDGSCEEELYADAVINGQRIELKGALKSFRHDHQIRMLPGDYVAHLQRNAHQTGDTQLFQRYDLLMPDKTVWQTSVTGISE